MTAAEHVVRVIPAHFGTRNKADLWVATCSTCWARSVPVMFKANAEDWKKAHLDGLR